MQANNKTELDSGIYLVQYGDTYVIENDNTRQTVKIRVVKSATLYDVFCGDTLFRSVAKAGLQATIEGAITAATGSPSGWLSGAIAADAAGRIYDWVCRQIR